MSKLVCLTFAAVLLLLFASRQSDQFLKYKVVEAYEVRTGILMMPRYSASGEICEIGLERRHYSPEKIYLDSTLSREEINQIADDVAPTNERGPRSKIMGERDLISESGHSLTTTSDYENISIQIYSDVLATSRKGEVVADIAATIKWKNRKCQ
ncbi:MAG: hypothetical protein WCA49_23200 [Candidatus Sulfotelmatobacter sp.]